jgi:hypothetical protein
VQSCSLSPFPLTHCLIGWGGGVCTPALKSTLMISLNSHRNCIGKTKDRKRKPKDKGSRPKARKTERPKYRIDESRKSERPKAESRKSERPKKRPTVHGHNRMHQITFSIKFMAVYQIYLRWLGAPKIAKQVAGNLQIGHVMCFTDHQQSITG